MAINAVMVPIIKPTIITVIARFVISIAGLSGKADVSIDIL
jgi:hypothetical protein